MKRICFQNNIPTAKFKICETISQVNQFLKECNLPIVVKADGLAAGKGVSICKTKKVLLIFLQRYLKVSLILLTK